MFGTVPASRASRESPFVVVMDVLRGLEECGFQKAREQLNKARFQCTNVSSFQSVNMDCSYSIGILAYVPRFGRPLDKVRMTAIARNTPLRLLPSKVGNAFRHFYSILFICYREIWVSKPTLSSSMIHTMVETFFETDVAFSSDIDGPVNG